MRTIRLFELEQEECVSLLVDAACVIEAETGMVWLTIENDPRDHWLAPGERFALHCGARAWLSTPQRVARLRVVPARQPRAGHGNALARLARALRRLAEPSWRLSR